MRGESVFSRKCCYVRSFCPLSCQEKNQDKLVSSFPARPLCILLMHSEPLVSALARKDEKPWKLTRGAHNSHLCIPILQLRESVQETFEYCSRLLEHNY